ncbi:hypothetical protein [Jiangella muralis]|uniref:hypothetical protein n=1 Tax=Jiangella muralis TaxID=702383 RepID=UPI00069EF8FE|nr:hypothetical protein [Jiangella muralis]
MTAAADTALVAQALRDAARTGRRAAAKAAATLRATAPKDPRSAAVRIANALADAEELDRIADAITAGTLALCSSTAPPSDQDAPDPARTPVADALSDEDAARALGPAVDEDDLDDVDDAIVFGPLDGTDDNQERT